MMRKNYILNFSSFLGDASEMSMINNPPHILSEEGKLIPSSLIPFCSFGSFLEGKVMPDISFPVCDLFDPVVHDGQLCYQIDVTTKMSKQSTVQGKGLTLIIDANTDKSVTRQIERFEKKNPKSLELQEAAVETKKLVGIHIGTLAPYNAFGPGNYILTSVKQMSATEGFLAMSSEKRECSKEKFETCQKRLLQERIKTCGCTPQNLIPALQDQAQVENLSFRRRIILFQAIVCPTIGLDCHSRYHQNSSCPIACEGVYADARRG